MDINVCAEAFDQLFSADRGRRILLVYDVIYQHCSGMFECMLRSTVHLIKPLHRGVVQSPENERL